MFNDFLFQEPTVSADLLCSIVCDQRNADLYMIELMGREVRNGNESNDVGYHAVKSAETQMFGMLTLLYKADVIDRDEFDELYDQIGSRYFGTYLKQLKGEDENG